jgi:hypothetical protein
MVRTSVLAAATAACLDSDALESLLEDIIDDNDDGRFRRKGGYMKGCTPRYGVANATSYLDRFRYRYWESEIWADIEDDRSYELSSVIAKDWRRDYLLPRAEFDRFVHDAGQCPELSEKAKGPAAVPLKHKIACCLYKWRMNMPYSVLKKCGRVSEPMIRKFATKLARVFVATYYTDHVHPPRSAAELARHLGKHAQLGFPGMLCFWDGTPVEWLNCPSGDHWKFQGKEGYPTVSYLIGGGMNREVFECSNGFTGTTNDTTNEGVRTMVWQEREGGRRESVYACLCLCLRLCICICICICMCGYACAHPCSRWGCNSI